MTTQRSRQLETKSTFTSRRAGSEGIPSQSTLVCTAKPEEVAAVLFLASEGSEFTTGAIIDINGVSYLRT